MKTITKYLTSFERANTYDDQVKEYTSKISYTELDEHGNVVLDKSFLAEENSSNTIRRTYDADNRVVTEQFFDGEDENLYESRRYYYSEANRIDHCEISYLEDKVTEKYIYSPEGHMLQKEVFYEDGSSYIETECIWNGKQLIEEKNYTDTNELQSRHEYSYDNEGRICKIVLYETDMDIVNKTTETYSYGPYGVEVQETYNISDQLVVRRTFSYDEQGRRREAIIESASSYFRHCYGYDADNRCILDQMLNKDGVILNEKRTTFDENGNELRIDVYSKNIVDNTDELLLIETYTTEYHDA